MTLYYSLVFLLLVFEMVVFMALIIPMPFTLKRKLFTFLAESPIIAKLQYGLKITFIFILILFLDSVNRVYRVQIEMAAYSKDGGARAAAVGSERMEVQARKFYSQRNMYLCGFTLFLSLILNRTYIMILEVLRLEEKLKMYEGDKKSGRGKLNDMGNANEVGQLKRDLSKKDKELQAMKKQAEGLQKEYDQLSVKYNQMNPESEARKDR